MKKELTILAIETSCDDTCVSIVKVKSQKSKVKSFDILSNIVSSQVKIHKKYGGVFPSLAKREHQNNLVPVLLQALKQAKLLNPKSKILISKQILNPKVQILNSILEREPNLRKKIVSFLKKYQKPKIDLIAVTNGPGLEPCLWVGVNFAKALSYSWETPIISVNHIKAHIFVNNLNKPLAKKDFPVICLVVSGGHTQLILMKDFGKYEILGETRDDAAGECFDKTARILGLGYPGGPAIAAEATKLSTTHYSLPTKLPRPMINSKDYDFSFSGLKTAVLYDWKKRSPKVKKSKEYIVAMAKEIQQAIIDVLISKTIRAAKNYKAKTIILGGGVIANEELRKQFMSKVYSLPSKVNLLIPPKNLCTDNAVMTAVAGYFRWKNKKIDKWQAIKAEANLRIV